MKSTFMAFVIVAASQFSTPPTIPFDAYNAPITKQSEVKRVAIYRSLERHRVGR